MALREINLVPNSVLSRRYIRRHLSFWAGLTVISLSVVFACRIYQVKAFQEKERELQGLKEVPRHLNLRIEEIGKLQKGLQKLVEQQAAVGYLSRAQHYHVILRRLSHSMNEATWLSRLTLDREGENARMTLNGYSLSSETLGHFLNRLSADPAFRSVELRLAAEAEVFQPGRTKRETRKATQFMIHFQVDGVR